MRLTARRVEADADGCSVAAALSDAGSAALGPLEVELSATGSWPAFSWALANAGDTPVAVRSVSLVFGLMDVVEPVRMFRNGYQSWSATGVATVGVDVDPSTRAGFEFFQAVHHADQRVVRSPSELRSEWVTLLADGRGDCVLVGFEAGSEHDGTLRLRRSTEAPGHELWAEAFLGDAVIAPGERRVLHGVVIDGEGSDLRPAELLERWATPVGMNGCARIAAPYQVGWCSWYHYFNEVTEAALRDNLARAEEWPFEVFQLDDGYQSAIGDWLSPNERFPGGLPGLADAIARSGYRPGLWIAPFLAAPDSRVATEHPEWLAQHAGRHGSKRPLYAWWNPAWGGGRDGFMYALDTTNPEVIDHLERLTRSLVEIGFTYLKLDFTFAPSVDGLWADPTRTPAQRVRAGYAAIRRGASDDTFILGCGVPLSHVLGLVDGNRIGPDVAPRWALESSAEVVPGYLAVQPATGHACANALTRSFMHRRLWLNDPDCVMLRAAATDLTPEAARTWARVVGISGGMALVSDDLSRLGRRARAVLKEAVTIGRASDQAARTGLPAVATDLLERVLPTTVTAAGYRLVIDHDCGASTLSSPLRPAS